MKRKHKVLSWWATIILVFVGFLLVGGITALVLFLTGRFDEEVIWPEEMVFSDEVTGSGYFDSDGNLRVASDFYITLTTQTEDVTKDKVTLFLDDLQGKTEDSVISVPKEVQLNKPFKVTLMVDEDGYANGGITTINAVSEDVTLQWQKLKVYVDKPLRENDFSVDIEGGNHKVVLGSTFNISTTYTSTESKKAFSSDEDKQLFFVNTNECIDYDWTNHRFYTKRVSGDSHDVITVYAFANAFFQKQILDRFESVKDDPETFSAMVTNYLRTTPNINESSDTYFTQEIEVCVRDAEVSSVVFSNIASSFQGLCDKFFTLTAGISKSDATYGDGFLGAAIKESGSDKNLDGLLGRLGIKIPKNDKIKIDNRQLTNLANAGKVIKVVMTNVDGAQVPQITEEAESFSYENYRKYTQAEEGTDYYLLPCISTENATDFYWRIVAEEADAYRLSINFFEENSDGTIDPFFELSEEPTFTFTADNHTEESATWKDLNTINMEIRFDDNGTPISDTVDLADFFGLIPTANVYTRIKYFLITSEAVSSEEMQSAFNVKAGKAYKEDYTGRPLTILGREMPADGFMLYEVEDGSHLVAKKGIAANVSVLIAIVRTDVDQNYVYDSADPTKYQIVNLSSLKPLKVDSSLSIALMDPRFQFTEAASVNTEEEKFYLPAINRDSDGNRKRVINLVLRYNCSENDPTLFAADSARILSAFKDGSIQILCADKQWEEYPRQYVYLSGQPTEIFYGDDNREETDSAYRRQTLYFRAELVIDESLFATPENADANNVNELEICLLLRYNDGQDVHSKKLTYLPTVDAPDGQEEKDSFVVYYQTPTKAEAKFETDVDIASNNEVEISIGQSNDEIKMTWGGLEYPGAEPSPTIKGMLDVLNDRLKVTLVDQHGKEIDPNTGIYRIVYSQNSAEQIIVFENSGRQSVITNFRNSGESTLTLRVVDSTNKQYLQSKEVVIKVTMVGVSKIEREKDGKIFDEAVPDSDRYIDNGEETGRATVSKILNPGVDQLDLTKLIKVYLGENETAEEDLKIQLSESFVNNLLESRSQDLAQMFTFTDSDGNAIDAAEGENMKKFLLSGGKSLNFLTVKYPLSGNTNLEFIVADKDGTRFNIPLTLVLQKQVSIGIGFDRYNSEQGYDKYLVEKENYFRLFADETYSLNELLPFTDNVVGDFNWNNAKLDVVGSDDSTLSIENGNLKIERIYSFTTVQITVYYGIESAYALNTERLTLYLNPNILIYEEIGQEERPSLYLNQLSEKKLGDHFKFYKATSYIKNNGDVSKMQSSDMLTLDNLTFTNNSATKIVNIESVGAGYAYKLGEDASALELELGQKLVQDYEINLSGNTTAFGAIRVQKKSGDEEVLILCENGKKVALSLGVGFSESEQQTIQDIFDGSLQVVQFEVSESGKKVLKTFVLMTSGKNYDIKSGYTFVKGTGVEQGSAGQTQIHVPQSQKLFDANNNFTISANVRDGSTNKDINLKINIIISRMGDKFVYYGENGEFTKNSNTAIGATARKYNTFADAEFGKLLANPASVDAYQKLYAGQTYTLLHFLNKEDSNEHALSADSGIYGFYIDYVASGQADKSSSLKLSYVAYQVIDGRKQELKETGALISRVGDDNFDVQFAHLASKYENLFVEFTLTIVLQSTSESYEWKYRVQIVPDFESGIVTYPFAEDAEYLDERSTTFVADDTDGQNSVGFGKYLLNLDEEFSDTNSNGKVSGARFQEPTALPDIYSGDDEVKGTYTVASATANGTQISDLENNPYFAFTLTNSNLEIVLKQADVVLTVVVRKSYTMGDLEAFGSEQEYELRFNQGKSYKVSVSYSGGDTSTPLREQENKKYVQTVKAGDNESTFTIDLSEFKGDTAITSPVEEYDFFVLGKQSDVLRSLRLDDGAVPGTKLLKVQPLDTIAKDATLEICIFTDQRIAVRIELSVTSFYVVSKNSNFVGGTVYDFVGESGIFEKIEDTKNNEQITSGSITLQSAEPDANVSLQGRTINKNALFKISDDGKTIEFSHLPEDVAFKFTATIFGYSFDFEVVVKKSAYIQPSDYYRFDQQGVLYGGLTYDLYLGEANSDEMTSLGNILAEIYYSTFKEQKIKKQNTTGTYQFVNEAALADNTQLKVRSVAENEEINYKTYTVKYTFDSGIGDGYSFDFALRFCYSIVPSVTVELNTPAPDGENYSDTEYLEVDEASKNVWETKTIQNFFGTAVEDFAMKDEKGAKKRVEVSPIADIDTNAQKKLDLEWRIEIKAIENVSLTVGGAKTMVTEEVKTLLDNVRVDSEQKHGGSDYETYLERQIGLNLKFALLDSTLDGTVEFGIYVNSVGAKLEKEVSNYKVVVLHAGASIVSVVTNPTNYEGNHETVYAEDLAKYDSKALFETNRILQFVPKVSGTQNWEFINGENTIRPISVDISQAQVGTVVNVDVGKDMSGFKFKDEAAIDSTFTVAPIFTSRLVVMYARGTSNERKILLDENMNFVLKIVGQDEWKKYDEIKLGKDDLKEEVKFDVAISRDISGGDYANQDLIKTNGQYAFLFDIDFEVKNASDNAKEIHVVDLVAGTTTALLGTNVASSLNNQIHIRSTRRNADYTAQMMNENSGSFDIQIYGFSENPVLFQNGGGGYTTNTDASNPYTDQKEQDLALVAGQVHENLQQEKNRAADGEWYYYTGLTPNAKMEQINSSSEKVNTFNYLVVRGAIEKGREKDYDIIAQGCNNDGNHVMVKVVYTVSTGEENISQAYNVLFRIIPNAMNGNEMTSQSMTNLTFRTKFNNVNAALAITDYSRTFGNGKQRYASNYDNANYGNMFEISVNDMIDNQNLYLYNANPAAAFENSVIVAHTYGRADKNYANEFKYTYTYSSNATPDTLDNITYNTFDFYGETASGGDWKVSGNEKTWTGDKNQSSLAFNMSRATQDASKIALGERYFYIDFENDYGFKGRFFFKIVADSNPVIRQLSSSTLHEKDLISIGAEFNVTDNITSNDNRYAVEAFRLQKKYFYGEKVNDVAPNDETEFAAVWNNYVSISNVSVTKVRIELKLEQGIVIEEETVTDFTREISGAATSFKIFDDKEWSYTPVNGILGKTHKFASGANLTEEEFLAVENSSITIFVEIAGASDSGLSQISIENRWLREKDATPSVSEIIPLSLQYRDLGIHQPNLVAADNKVNITLANIKAYGFQTKDIKKKKLVDENSKYSSSDIGNVTVTGVNFFYRGKNIGQAAKTEQYQGKDVAVLTDEQYTFWNQSGEGAAKTVAGISDPVVAGKATGQFVVPNLTPGKLFGTSLTLENVTMRISIKDKSGQTAELDYVVKFTRDNVDLFGTNGGAKDVKDTEKPVVTNHDVKVKNDTLEVVLEKDESTTFFITDESLDDEKISSITESGSAISYTSGGTTRTGATISLTNMQDYTQTEYVSINNSWVGGASQEEYLNKFYVYEIVDANAEEKETDSEVDMFHYNSNSIQGKVAKIKRTTTQLAGGIESVSYALVDETNAKENSIDGYNSSIRLYIPSVDALSGDSLKETLYFLYDKNVGEDSRTYQYKQDFNIYPLYKQATRGDNKLPDNKIEVYDYIKVSDNAETTFYYIPLDSWAGEISDYQTSSGTEKQTGKQRGGIELTSYLSSGDSSDSQTLMKEEPYKFTFAIQSESEAGGSAFVDEFGMITTTKTFKILRDVVSVKIFMKVSGFDGNFEEENNNSQRLLGMFSIILVERDWAASSTSSGYHTYFYNNALRGILNLSGMTAYYDRENRDIGSVSFSGDYLGSFACEKGTVLDFHKLLDKTVNKGSLAGISNKKYHILKDGETDINAADNIDHWKFDNVGEKDVYIVVTGRKNGAYVSEPLKIKLNVYDKTTREEFSFAVNSSSTEFNLTGNLDSTEGKTGITWQSIDMDTNIIEQVVDGKISLNSKSLVQEKVFIENYSQNGVNVQKTYKVKFYLYSKESSESVGMFPGTFFNLRNLVNVEENFLYEFHKVEGVKITNDDSTYTPNNSREEPSFIIVKKDAKTGKVSDVTMHKVTFKTLNTSVDKESGCFAKRTVQRTSDGESATVTCKTIKDKIVEMFGLTTESKEAFKYISDESKLENNTFIVETRSSTGVLTKICSADEENATFEVSAKAVNDAQEFVVTYKTSDKIYVKRAMIRFFLYDNEGLQEVKVSLEEEYAIYYLRNANQKIMEELGITDNKSTIAYYEVNEKDGSKALFDRINDLNFGDKVEKTLFVEAVSSTGVSTGYYINLVLECNSVQEP